MPSRAARAPSPRPASSWSSVAASRCSPGRTLVPPQEAQMIEGPALRNLTAAIADACRSGLDPDGLRAAVLPRLRRAVPIDALWWATSDPVTLLFTQAHREGLPEEIGPYFVHNEFLDDDANKWAD